METTKIKDKKSSKHRDSVVQTHKLKYAQQGASPGKPPQGAGSSSKPRDTEHLITPEAGPSSLTEQGASIGKPAEEDIKVQQLPSARTKLPGAARRKLRKAKEGQRGTGSLTQLGHKTSPQPSMGPKRHRSGGSHSHRETSQKIQDAFGAWVI
jgi:hypothetical protein